MQITSFISFIIFFIILSSLSLNYFILRLESQTNNGHRATWEYSCICHLITCIRHVIDPGVHSIKTSEWRIRFRWSWTHKLLSLLYPSHLPTNLTSRENSVAVLSLNSQSILAKSNGLQVILELLTTQNIHFLIICIQVTWLQDETNYLLYF